MTFCHVNYIMSMNIGILSINLIKLNMNIDMMKNGGCFVVNFINISSHKF